MTTVILSFSVASFTQNLSMFYEYDGPDTQSCSAHLWEHSHTLTPAKEANLQSEAKSGLLQVIS